MTLKGMRFAARRLWLGAADYIVTMPLLRWTWTGLADDAFAGELPEFRPSDRETVRDMMAGRYLLASKLVETGGASPFDFRSRPCRMAVESARLFLAAAFPRCARPGRAAIRPHAGARLDRP